MIVANVSHKLDIENLWSPNAFNRQYGHIRHDIINTHSGKVIPKAKLKKFWDGFENLSERMLDDVGKPMSLKVLIRDKCLASKSNIFCKIQQSSFGARVTCFPRT